MMINSLAKKYMRMVILLLLILFSDMSCNKIPSNKAMMAPSSSSITPTFSTEIAPSLTQQPTLQWTPALEAMKANLLGKLCETPCWYGIVPGQTPADQIPHLLDELKEQGILEKYNRASHPTSIRYFIRFTALPEHLIARIDIDEERNIVTNASFTSYSKFINLGDVIDAYGEPEIIARGEGDTFNGVYLGYQEKGISLSVRTDSVTEDKITSDLNVVNMRYLSEYANNHEINSPDITWVEWEGYQTFSYYYDKFYAASETSQD